MLVTNLIRTDDHINHIDDFIRALYLELVLFLRRIDDFIYIPENESLLDILGWNKSIGIRKIHTMKRNNCGRVGGG